MNDDSLGINREVYRGTSYINLSLLHIFTVHIMGSFGRQTLIVEARTEKPARGTFYSAVQRLLSKDDIVIADGLNYIKGFRYQLFCEAKALSTPHCVVIHALTPC